MTKRLTKEEIDEINKNLQWRNAVNEAGFPVLTKDQYWIATYFLVDSVHRLLTHIKCLEEENKWLKATLEIMHTSTPLSQEEQKLT